MGTPVALVGPVWGPTIDVVQVDVALSERHELEAEISEHPIETGSSLADHRRVQPRRLTIMGVLSDLPASQQDARIRRVDSDEFEIVTTAEDRETAESRYKTLVRLAEAPEPFTVVTGLDVYESMHFTRFSVERDRNTGAIIKFDGELRKMLFAQSEEVVVIANKVDAPKVVPKTNVGAKATTPPITSVEEPTSILNDLIGGEGGARSFKGLIGG